MNFFKKLVPISIIMIHTIVYAQQFQHTTTEIRNIFNDGIFKTDWLVGSSPYFVTVITSRFGSRLVVWDVDCKDRSYRALLSKKFVSQNFVYDAKEILRNSPWVSIDATPGGRAIAAARCG